MSSSKTKESKLNEQQFKSTMERVFAKYLLDFKPIKKEEKVSNSLLGSALGFISNMTKKNRTNGINRVENLQMMLGTLGCSAESLALAILNHRSSKELKESVLSSILGNLSSIFGSTYSEKFAIACKNTAEKMNQAQGEGPTMSNWSQDDIAIKQLVITDSLERLVKDRGEESLTKTIGDFMDKPKEQVIKEFPSQATELSTLPSNTQRKNS